MKSTLTLLFALFFSASSALAAATQARVMLVGDSTMAPRSGYGDALCARFTAAVECLNLAKGGRSSKSYRAEGSWENVIATLMRRDVAVQYVLVQFGHNDQPGKGDRTTTLQEYAENLARYVQEIRRAGARPVLVSPLTRRQFKEGKVIRSLEQWAAVMRAVAAQTKTPLIDLHEDSVIALEQMGSPEANTLAQASPPAEVVAASLTGTTIEAPKPAQPDPDRPSFDYTHLGVKGADFFSAMVAEGIGAAVPDLAKFLRSE